MFGCRHHTCPGHEDILQAILHTLEHLVSTVEQVTADFTTYQTDVSTALGGLAASVADLKTQLAAALANQGGVPPAVQASIDALDAQVVAADAALKP